MNVDEIVGDSCFASNTTWDCLERRLFMGVVGGALLRTDGLLQADDPVVGILP